MNKEIEKVYPLGFSKFNFPSDLGYKIDKTNWTCTKKQDDKSGNELIIAHHETQGIFYRPSSFKTYSFSIQFG